ncbi:MAG: DUF1844 domain-containing protein [Phycisphaerae bacterium]|jgi:hypothetical protein
MSDEGKKLIADDDWKEEARREKEKLAAQEAAAREKPPEASLADLVNLIGIQAMVGLGMMAGPQGERIPPNLEIAKHFIDLLGVLQEKTKNNLTAEEQSLLDQVAYDLRMRFVELAKMAGAAVPPKPEAPPA